VTGQDEPDEEAVDLFSAAEKVAKIRGQKIVDIKGNY
jgi:hypothetical protein